MLYVCVSGTRPVKCSGQWPPYCACVMMTGNLVLVHDDRESSSRSNATCFGACSIPLFSNGASGSYVAKMW